MKTIHLIVSAEGSLIKYQRTYLKIQFKGEGYGEYYEFIFFINADDETRKDIKERLLRDHDVEEVEDFLLAHYLPDITPSP